MTKKISLTALLFCCFLASFAQKRTTPLKKALLHIEDLHRLEFSYADDLISNLVVTLSDEEAELSNQLQTLEAQTGLSFEINGSIVLIKPVSRNFCLSVVDAQTGTPLPGTQLAVNGKATNYIATIDGSIKFTSSLSFQDTLSLVYFGYDTRHIMARQLLTGCPDIGLEFGETTLDEVLITHYISSGINASQDDHSLIIKTDDLALLPGETDNDILLAIKTLPGINSPNGKAGNLHVRGSTTDQTLVLFDNIPIYHKGHYFGAISPYNPQLVDEVSVHRSGYGPDLGGRVGGAIEMKTSRTIPDSSVHGISLNTYYGAAFSKIKVSDKIGLAVSARSTYTPDWRPPKLEAINELVFQPSIISLAEENPTQEVVKNDYIFRDVNLNTNYKTNTGIFSLGLLHIHNDNENIITRSTNNSVRDFSNKLNNNGANLEWLNSWSKKLYTQISATYSEYSYFSEIKENLPGDSSFIPDRFENDIIDAAIKLEGNALLNIEKDSRLSFGYQVNKHLIRNSNFSQRPNRPERDFRSEAEGYVHALFLNHKILLADKLTLNSGIRSSYFTATEDVIIEPRLFVNYDLTDAFALKASTGLYSQFITQNVFFDFEDTKVENLRWDLASTEQPVVKSRQHMVGFLWRPKNFIIDAEIYYKDVENLSTTLPGPTPQLTFGDLSVYGFDLLVRKSFGKLDTWVSYSHTMTDMTFPELNQLSFETYYDQPHALNINSTLPWRQWKFSLGWQYLSGVPVYTNNTFFPSPGTTAGPPPPGGPRTIPAEENEGRFSAQHQLDLSVVFQFPKRSKGWRSTVGVSVLNLYDQDNLVAENYLTFGPNTTLEERRSIGFAWNIMASIKF